MKHRDQTVLITGASAGIGLELAKIFAARGYDLVLVARREDKLHEIAQSLEREYSVAARVITKDLNEPAAPQQLFAELRGTPVDILVNNAGFGDFGAFAEGDLETQLAMLQVNVVALTHLTHLFLPAMKAKRRGKILNTASTAAFFPGPLMAVYYASKAYVLSFSVALSNELKGSGVSATCLCPGPTQTEFQDTAGLGQSKLIEAAMMDAATVARIGYNGLMRRRAVVVPGATNKAVTWWPRVLSLEAAARMIRRVQDAKK